MRDKYKEFEDAWKLKLKKEEEELDIEELDEDVATESDTQIRDVHNLDDIDSDDLSPVEIKKFHKKSLKKDSSDSDSDEKPAKKPAKKSKKVSSSDSDSDSDSSD